MSSVQTLIQRSSAFFFSPPVEVEPAHVGVGSLLARTPTSSRCACARETWMVDLLGHLNSPIGINVGAAVCVYMKSLWETGHCSASNVAGPPSVWEHPAAG